MKTTLILIVVLVIAALPALAAKQTSAEPPAKCGGFNVEIVWTAPGEGTFHIWGENDYGQVDVNGTITKTVDPETRTWSCLVVFGEGSYVQPDGCEPIFLDGTELLITGDKWGQKRVGYQIVQYLKSLLEEGA